MRTSQRVTVVFAIATLAIGALLVPACSSSSDTGSAPGTTGADPFTEPNGGATGKYETKDEACRQFAAILKTKADALKPPCVISPDPVCPDLLDRFEASQKAAHPGLCFAGYDIGSLENCARRVSAYTTCSDFANPAKVCVIGFLNDPNKCTGDAGTDAGRDASDAADGSLLDADPSDGG